MFDALESIDRQLLLLINGWNSPFCDELMWLISGRYTWIPLYVILIVAMLRKTGRQWWLMLIGVALAVGLADIISVQCFKYTVMRYRPTHNLELEGVLHIVHGYHGGLYGFVSSHAANTFAIALFSSLMLQRRIVTVLVFAWACLVCYSRMYIGAHYPADIACGALVGALCGYAAYRLYQWQCNKRLSTHKPEKQQNGRD